MLLKKQKSLESSAKETKQKLKKIDLDKDRVAHSSSGLFLV